LFSGPLLLFGSPPLVDWSDTLNNVTTRFITSFNTAACLSLVLFSLRIARISLRNRIHRACDFRSFILVFEFATASASSHTSESAPNI
jgi:hypothetical protein